MLCEELLNIESSHFEGSVCDCGGAVIKAECIMAIDIITIFNNNN